MQLRSCGLVTTCDHNYVTKWTITSREMMEWSKQSSTNSEQVYVTRNADSRKKLDEDISNASSRDLWRGMSKVTGYKPSWKGITDDDCTLPDRLNEFYSRFNRPVTTTPPSALESKPPLTVTNADTRRAPSNMKQRARTASVHVFFGIAQVNCPASWLYYSIGLSDCVGFHTSLKSLLSFKCQKGRPSHHWMIIDL